MLVEALVSELAIEALDECVLGGFAWLNEVKSHLVLISPSVECPSDELRAVVGHEAARIATLGSNGFESAHDGEARERSGDLDGPPCQ